jgi:hypothetical protein
VANILYKARSSAGAEVAGYVEAETAQDAVARLKASGLTDIELHESPSISGHHGLDLAGLTDAQAAEMAAFQLRIRSKPGLATLLGEVVRRQRLWIAAYVGLLVAGLVLGRLWLAVAGVLLLALTFGPPAWSHRFSRRFDRMLRAMALGEWNEAARMLALFRQRKHPESIEVSIPFYDAQIRVRQGEALQPILARLELMRPRVSAAMFPARLATVHSAARDYDGFLSCMAASWEATPQDPSRQVDYALALARFGDLVKAQQLLDGIDMEALQVQGRPYVWWARGLIELRNGKPTAQAALLKGVEGFLQIVSPVGWSSLALCSGACALAMQRSGDAAGAKTMIGRVWPVLKVYADTRLRAEIDKEIGTP